MARSNKSKRQSGQSDRSSNMSPTSTGAMTPQEAGRLGGQKGGSKGGKAPHQCRGFECQK
jgi:hypothetical protein